MEQTFDILLPRHTLEEALGPELAKQYRLRRGESCVYMPVNAGAHYLCTCGTVNARGETCGQCGRPPEFLDRSDLEALRREAEVRLEAEAAEQAELERQKREAEKRQRRKKTVRAALAVAGAVVFLVLAAAAFWGITRFAIPAGHYRKGLAALAEKDYQKAHRCFVLAGDYKDAEAYLERFYTPCLSVRSTVGFTVGLTAYTYDEKGLLLRTTSTPHQIDANGQLNPVGEPVVYTQLYDQDGRVLVVQDWYGKNCYAYDARGSVISEISYRAEGDEHYNKSFTYTYDAQGRVLQVDEICSNFISLSYSYEQSTQYVYDESGRKVKQYLQVNYPASMEACYSSETTYTYDDRGRLIRSEEQTAGLYDSQLDSREVSTWKYDAQGRQMERCLSVEYLSDSARNLVRRDTCSYDRKGRLVEERSVSSFPNDPDRDSLTQHIWKYNWEGRLTEETASSEFDDSERHKYSGYTYATAYTYDLLGRRVKIVQKWDYAGEDRDSVQTQVYEYGADDIADRAEVTVKTDDGTEVSVVTFNENGLAEVVAYSMGEEESVTEYTYAYYYYPEGTEMPKQSSTGGQLYGDGYYNG